MDVETSFINFANFGVENVQKFGVENVTLCNKLLAGQQKRFFSFDFFLKNNVIQLSKLFYWKAKQQKTSEVTQLWNIHREWKELSFYCRAIRIWSLFHFVIVLNCFSLGLVLFTPIVRVSLHWRDFILLLFVAHWRSHGQLKFGAFCWLRLIGLLGEPSGYVAILSKTLHSGISLSPPGNTWLDVAALKSYAPFIWSRVPRQPSPKFPWPG